MAGAKPDEKGDSWDLYVAPKKAKKEDAPAAPPATDGAELSVAPKKPKDGGGAAAPQAQESGGAMELPGSPRPKPKVDKAVSEEAGFRAQRPGGVEEDAEIYDSKLGKWARPSGKLVEGDEGYVKPPGEGDKSSEDEDTELVVAPKKRTVAAPGAGPKGPTKSRTRDSMTQVADGTDGRDFQEYVKPLVPPAQPPAAAPLFGSTLGLPSRPASPSAPAGGVQKPLYGQSSVPAAPPPADNLPRAPPGQVHAAALPHGVLNVLLVGSGAREHAMALAIRRSQRAHLFVVTRHRNPGLVKSATGFKILPETDVAGIVAWARMQKIHLAVTGPESAIQAGLTDALRAAGIAVASPSQAAGRIETDKAFMRSLMRKHRLPGQLAFHPFSDEAGALAFLDKNGPRWAVKPVGLTGGKGVQVYGDHFRDAAGAKAYVRSIFAGQLGAAKGNQAVVQFEELAVGEEYSVMAFTDGTTVRPMPAVQDHKRLLEGDRGPNTGGMGSYAQADGLLPFLTRDDYDESVIVVQSIVDALRAEGTPYVGAIYGQFMLTADGPRIIEVNARFGDPEAMNVLATLESDYGKLLEAMATGQLAGQEARFRPAATVVKYVVPPGYGDGSPEPGRPVQVDDFNVKRCRGMVYYGSIEQQLSGVLAALTSRTLAVLGEAATLGEANAICEASLRHVHAPGFLVRHDIASPELLERRVAHMDAVRHAGTAEELEDVGDEGQATLDPLDDPDDGALEVDAEPEAATGPAPRRIRRVL